MPNFHAMGNKDFRALMQADVPGMLALPPPADVAENPAMLADDDPPWGGSAGH